MLKTFHDIALGFFVNAGYGITQGGSIEANVYVLVVSVLVIYFANRRLEK